MPIAFTTTMLAWSLLAFPDSFTSNQSTLKQAKDSVRWGTDYLNRAFHPLTDSNQLPLRIAYQVGAAQTSISSPRHA